MSRRLLLLPLLVLALLIPGVAFAACTPLGTTTPNLSLCKPASGETGWASAVNGNWDSIDTLSTSLSVGPYSSRNLVGQNDGSLPNTKWGFSADILTLRNPTTGALVTRTSVATVTCNLGVVGPNGLDTGSQQASTWYHFYGIWNGTTVACLASATAPVTGPTLPTGYTHWAYAAAVFSDGTTHLVKTRARGTWMDYESQQTVVNGSSATTETAQSTASFVPPNALRVALTARLTAAADGGGIWSLTPRIRVISGSGYWEQGVVISGTAAGATQALSWTNLIIPNVAQNFYFLTSVANGNSQSLFVTLTSYSVPNGGD
jgi:hypothetical protein